MERNNNIDFNNDIDIEMIDLSDVEDEKRNARLEKVDYAIKYGLDVSDVDNLDDQRFWDAVWEEDQKGHKK